MESKHSAVGTHPQGSYDQQNSTQCSILPSYNEALSSVSQKPVNNESTSAAFISAGTVHLSSEPSSDSNIVVLMSSSNGTENHLGHPKDLYVSTIASNAPTVSISSSQEGLMSVCEQLPEGHETQTLEVLQGAPHTMMIQSSADDQFLGRCEVHEEVVVLESDLVQAAEGPSFNLMSEHEEEVLISTEDNSLDHGIVANDHYVSLQECMDHNWTKEKLVELLKLHSSKEGWEDYSFHPVLYQELVDSLGMSDEVDWQQVRNKWQHMQCLLQVSQTEEQLLDSDACANELNVKSEDDGLSATKSRRRSPEYYWSSDVTKHFIKLRADKHPDISKKGHTAVYQEILDELQISDKVTVMMARKKWNYLVNRYQDESRAGGDRSWPLMDDMSKVMSKFYSSDITKLKSRASPEFLWPNDLTLKFIDLRVEMHESFSRNGIQQTYSEMLHELGLVNIITANHLRKKWNYLVAKYKELSNSNAEASQMWPFFDRMARALRSTPSGTSAINDSQKQTESIWTKQLTTEFIKLRGAKSREQGGVSTIFTEIINELNIGHVVKPFQARRKWNNLWYKYQELNDPKVSEFTRNSWPYFAVMRSVAADIPITVHNTISTLVGVESARGSKDEDGHKSQVRRVRKYTCFLCASTGNNVTDFFMFDYDQHLHYTKKTVMDVLSHFMGKRLHNLEGTTVLCHTCTHLVNEADSVIHNHEQIKSQVRSLFEGKVHQVKVEDSCEITIKECSMPDLESSSTVELPPTEEISYSKRGRKRKAAVFSEAVQSCLNLSAADDEDLLDHDLLGTREARGTRRRGRGRGRSRGSKSRPAVRTTLIGRGLEGQYPTTNKRAQSLALKGLKVYSCSECSSEFRKYTDLVAHRKEVHTVIDNTPLEVEETILESGVITYFNKDKANSVDTSHPCRECGKVFLRKDDLSYHYEISHTEGKGRTKTAFKDKSYVCEECGESFLFKYKLKLHINNKHLNDTGKSASDFTCGDCNSKLGSLPGLTFHMRKHHNKSLTYKKNSQYLCSDCGFLATSNRKLKEHQNAHCGFAEKEQVQCEICGKTVLKVSLKMHKIKMHSDFKEQCDKCGERYATKTDLLRHINVVHLKIMLYACKHCDQKFPTSDSLRYHRVKMHERPSFFCHICSKSYKRVGELNTHIKRAHNDRRKAEVCSYCGKEYYDRSGLRNHLISKHNVPQALTYTENYLRKKRVDGLPLCKHIEKRMISEENKQDMDVLQQIVQEHENSQQQQQLEQQQRHAVQHIQQHDAVQSQHSIPVHHHPMVDDAARTLARYNEGNGTPDEPLIVTEISEDHDQSQQILVDQMGNIIQDNVTLHTTGTIMSNNHHHQSHHHVGQHQQLATLHQNHATVQQGHQQQQPRIGVIYQMNHHAPSTSHMLQ